MRPPQRLMGVMGQTARIYAREVAGDGYFLGGSRAYPERFAWFSDNTAIATVDSLGTVTAVGEGVVRITATSHGITGITTLTVRDAARVVWSLPVGGAVDAGLTLADDGTIYVAAAGALNAVDAAGHLLWRVPTGHGPHSTPAVARDGTVYVATLQPGRSLTAFDRSGALLWRAPGVGGSLSSPALATDGTIYVASRDSTLYAVNPEGQTVWGFKAQDAFLYSSPAVGADGTIYVGAQDGRLYAIDPHGSERWATQTGGPIWSSPAIAADGTILVGSHDEHLYALRPDGSVKWSLALGEEIWSSPSIGADGTIYVGAMGIHAVDPSGRLQWTFTGAFPPTDVNSTPVVAGDGTIYVGGMDRHIWAIAPDGTPKWDLPTENLVVASPAIGLDGMVLAASYDGTLYAIVESEAAEGSVTHDPWPKHRGDRFNTGRTGVPGQDLRSPSPH